MCVLAVRLSVSSCILLLMALPSVDSRATFVLKLIKYINHAGQDSAGQSCDIFGACDHSFRFCLESYYPPPNDHKNFQFGQCNYLDAYTGRMISGSTNLFYAFSKIGGMDNPIVRSMPEWPGQIMFKINVMDDDTLGDHDHVDTMFSLIQVKPARSQAEEGWHKISITGTRRSNPTNLDYQYQLYCDPDYYGARCDKFCVASDNVFTGHYTCHPDTGEIVCLPGYESPKYRCKIVKDNCPPGTCKNGGTCVDLPHDFLCLCRPGYTAKTCSIEIDHCQSNPCTNGATCINNNGQYVCQCPQHYLGTNCDYHICETVDACTNGGTCVGNGECFCADAYTGSRCETRICDTLNCQNGGKCATDKCLCPKTHTGKECEIHIDPCKGVTCYNGGTCQNGTCACAIGYVGSVCQGILDHCLTRPCKNESTCKTTTQGYECLCKPGFTGKHCNMSLTTEYYCNDKKCQHGGTCINLPADYLCLCPSGTYGKTCTPEINHCDSNPCQNGALCINNDEEYVCKCQEHFLGQNCELHICNTTGACSNGGTCVGNGECICQKSFTGSRCETNLCDTLVCENGGKCSKGECLCPAAYTGPRCEVKVKGGDDPPPVNVAPLTSKENVDWWVYLVSGLGALLVLVLVIVGVVIACYKRKNRQLKEQHEGQNAGSGTVENPAFHVETNVYDNVPPPVPMYNNNIAPTDPKINLNIAPRDKVIHDVPRRQANAHGAGASGVSGENTPAYSKPRKSSLNTASGKFKTPKHLEERYLAMKKAALDE